MPYSHFAHTYIIENLSKLREMHSMNSYCLHTAKKNMPLLNRNNSEVYQLYNLCDANIFWSYSPEDFFVSFWLSSHWEINCSWIIAPITHLTIPQESKSEYFFEWVDL